MADVVVLPGGRVGPAAGAGIEEFFDATGWHAKDRAPES
jgi:hypothetical protein